jgi:hypothetical protein
MLSGPARRGAARLPRPAAAAAAAALLRALATTTAPAGGAGAPAPAPAAGGGRKGTLTLPPGAVAVEALGAVPKTPRAKPGGGGASDDSCGPLPADDDDLSDMVPMIDPATGAWGLAGGRQGRERERERTGGTLGGAEMRGAGAAYQRLVQARRRASPHTPTPPPPHHPTHLPAGEWGGPTKGGTAPEPTRFGDWERKGRCTDFS